LEVFNKTLKKEVDDLEKITVDLSLAKTWEL
jgi:hypothetical protein